MFFFVNDTATTEIYTYGHTLSLHDALPICSTRPRSPRPATRPVRRPGSRQQEGSTPLNLLRPHCRMSAPVAGPEGTNPSQMQREAPRRSEEHTSELQSLMRISYAVFCLKKKKKHNNRQNHKHNN